MRLILTLLLLNVLILPSNSTEESDREALAREMRESQETPEDEEEELEAMNEGLQKSVKAIQEMVGDGGKIDPSKMDMSKLLNDDLIKQMNKHYKDQNEEEIQKGFEDMLKQQHGFDLSKYPKVSLFFARILKDQDAMPSLFKIIKNREKLMYFGFAMLGTIILGFLIKRAFRKLDSSIFRDIKLFFMRVFLLLGARIFILISFFGTELRPTWNIFKSVL